MYLINLNPIHRIRKLNQIQQTRHGDSKNSDHGPPDPKKIDHFRIGELRPFEDIFLKPESPKAQNPGNGDSQRPRRTTTHTHRTSSIFNSKNLSSFKHRIKLARVPVFLSLPFARGKGSRPLKFNSLSFVVFFGSLVCPKSSKGPYYLTTVTLRQE